MKEKILYVFMILMAALFVASSVGFVRDVLAKPAFPPQPDLPPQVCDNGEHVGNPHCITPTPTVVVTPTVSPTSTPSATPTQEPITPTPTEVPGNPPPSDHGDGLSDNRSDGKHTAGDGLGCGTHDCSSPFDGAPVAWK